MKTFTCVKTVVASLLLQAPPMFGHSLRHISTARPPTPSPMVQSQSPPPYQRRRILEPAMWSPRKPIQATIWK